MKHLLIFSSLAFCALTVSNGCKKAAKPTSTHYVSASSGTIGSFYASGAQVSAAGATGAKLEIDATNASGDRMTIFVNPYAGATGVLSVSGTYVGGQYNSVISDTVAMSVYGHITLTSVTPDIIGTFTYKGTDSSVYTGAFNVAAP